MSECENSDFTQLKIPFGRTTWFDRGRGGGTARNCLFMVDSRPKCSDPPRTRPRPANCAGRTPTQARREFGGQTPNTFRTQAGDENSTSGQTLAKGFSSLHQKWRTAHPCTITALRANAAQTNRRQMRFVIVDCELRRAYRPPACATSSTSCLGDFHSCTSTRVCVVCRCGSVWR